MNLASGSGPQAAQREGNPTTGPQEQLHMTCYFSNILFRFFMVVDGTQVMILPLLLGSDHMSEPLLGAYYLLSLFCLSKKLSKYVKITHYLFKNKIK
jgi:hypothetical protein